MKTVLKFSKLEVLAFLEDLIISGEANNEELTMYEQYKWDGKLNKHTYDKVISKMKKAWKEKF